MLVLGAQLGLFFGQLCQSAFPGLNIQPEGFAVVGMAAFFTGVVRAPLTGIVLVIEMTADVTMLLPMLGACFMAMLTPTLLGDRANLRFVTRTHFGARKSTAQPNGTGCSDADQLEGVDAGRGGLRRQEAQLANFRSSSDKFSGIPLPPAPITARAENPGVKAREASRSTNARIA